MARYTPDLTKASFGFIQFPKGTHRVEFGTPRSFEAKPPKDNHGVRFADSKVIATDAEESLVGKKFPQTLYMHTEGAINYSKGIQAAVLGCKTDPEFNDKYGQEDWGYETSDGSCGSGWHLMKGKVVDIDCDEPELDTNGNPQTKILRYRVVE